MTFLVRPSTKATQPVLLFWTLLLLELKIELFTQHLIHWSRSIITKNVSDWSMFLILLKIIQLCLIKCSQCYDSGERSRATHDCHLVQYIIWGFPLFGHIFPIHPIYIFLKTNQTHLPYFNFPCSSKLTFFCLSNFVCILSYFYTIFLSFQMFHKFIWT